MADNTIPTIENFIREKVYITQDGAEDIHDSLSKVCDAVTSIVELHVTAALKAAAKNALIEHDHFDDMAPYVSKSSILNSYPLENIK